MADCTTHATESKIVLAGDMLLKDFVKLVKQAFARILSEGTIVYKLWINKIMINESKNDKNKIRTKKRSEVKLFETSENVLEYVLTTSIL